MPIFQRPCLQLWALWKLHFKILGQVQQHLQACGCFTFWGISLLLYVCRESLNQILSFWCFHTPGRLTVTLCRPSASHFKIWGSHIATEGARRNNLLLHIVGPQCVFASRETQISVNILDQFYHTHRILLRCGLCLAEKLNKLWVKLTASSPVSAKRRIISHWGQQLETNMTNVICAKADPSPQIYKLLWISSILGTHSR